MVHDLFHVAHDTHANTVTVDSTGRQHVCTIDEKTLQHVDTQIHTSTYLLWRKSLVVPPSIPTGVHLLKIASHQQAAAARDENVHDLYRMLFGTKIQLKETCKHIMVASGFCCLLASNTYVCFRHMSVTISVRNIAVGGSSL